MVEARTRLPVLRSTLGLSHLTLDLEFAQPHQRLAATLLALGGRAQPGGLFATLAGCRIALQFALEPLDPLGHLLADRRQPAMPTERCRPGRGADLDAVLRQAFQTDQAILDQRRHAVGQQPIQHRLMIGAEVRKSMVVHPHAAAEPAIDEVALAQAHDLAGAADTVDHGIKPQRQQQTRIDRRPPHRVRARLDRSVKFTQLQRRHEAPHQTSRMIERDQGIEINDLPGRLVAPGLLHPRGPGANRSLRSQLLRKLLEQTRSRHRRLSRSRTQQRIRSRL